MNSSFQYYINLLLVGISALSLSNCQPEDKPGNKIERENEPTIYTTAADDPAMEESTRLSKATLPAFLRILKQHDTTATDFGLKVHYDDEGQSEHLWLVNLSIQGAKLYGVVSNLPEFTKKVKAGERVEIDTSMVSDWKYIQNHRLVGGRTIKVLVNRMSPAEKAEFNASIDYKIE
jgi:uncharacterized protein YegJ (DUF2314 family)